MIDLVLRTASDEYLDFDTFLQAIAEGEEEIHSLLGAGIGLSGEVGEFNEILKKHIWQKKPFDRNHAIKELGDIYWYFALACIALKTTPEEVANIVREKLMARYAQTDGKFTLEQNENRKSNDV